MFRVYFKIFLLLFLFCDTLLSEFISGDSILNKKIENILKDFEFSDTILIMGKLKFKYKEKGKFVEKNEVEIIIELKEENKNISVKSDEEGFLFFAVPLSVNLLKFSPSFPFKFIAIRCDDSIYPVFGRVAIEVIPFLKVNILKFNIKSESYTLEFAGEEKEILYYFMDKYSQSEYIPIVQKTLRYYLIFEKLAELLLKRNFKRAEKICVENMLSEPDSPIFPYLMKIVALENLQYLSQKGHIEKIKEKIKEYKDIAKTAKKSGILFFAWLCIDARGGGIYEEGLKGGLRGEIAIELFLEFLSLYLNEREILKLKFTAYSKENPEEALKVLNIMARKKIKPPRAEVEDLIEEFYYKKEYKKVILILENLNSFPDIKDSILMTTHYYLGSLYNVKDKKRGVIFLKNLLFDIEKMDTFSSKISLYKIKPALFFSFLWEEYKITEDIFNQSLQKSNDYDLSNITDILTNYEIKSLKGKEKELLFFFKKFLKPEEKRWYLFKGIANIYFSMENYDSAEIFYEKSREILKSKLKHSQLYFRDLFELYETTFSLFEIFMKKGETQKAINTLKEILKSYPDSKNYIKSGLKSRGYENIYKEIFKD